MIYDLIADVIPQYEGILTFGNIVTILSFVAWASVTYGMQKATNREVQRELKESRVISQRNSEEIQRVKETSLVQNTSLEYIKGTVSEIREEQRLVRSSLLKLPPKQSP